MSTTSTYNHYNDAIEFREAMGQPINEPGNEESFPLQVELIEEEMSEFEDEVFGPDLEYRNDFDPEDTLKELADLVYVCYQLAALMGWNLDTALRRVHTSNMSKLVDGKPQYREDGKVLKGPNYQPPNLSDLV